MKRKLSKLTLKELLPLVKSGTDDAEEELVLRFDNLIKAVAAQYHIPGVELDDLIQTGRIKLLETAAKCDEDKTEKFASFLSRALKNAYNDVARSAGTNGLTRIVPFDAYDFDDEDDVAAPESKIPSEALSPEEELIKKEIEADFFATLNSLLSGLEYKILVMYIYSKSYKEIASNLGISEKKVDNAIYSAKKKYLAFRGDDLAHYKK